MAHAQPAGSDAEESATEAEAAAEVVPEEIRESIRVIQQRPIMRRHRVELQAFGGLGLADTMFRNYFAAGTLRFHFNEQWSIGGSYAHYFAEESSLFEDVTDNYELFPERSLIEWFAGGDVSWTPIHGKFAAFGDNIIHFDLSTTVGAGVLSTTRTDDLRVAGVIGFGWRVFFTEWLAWTTEVRDHIYVEKYNAGDELVNHVVFQTGFSLFFPFDYEYRYPR